MRLPGLLPILLLLPILSPAQTPAGPALFDSALAQVGLTHDDVRFDTDEMEIFRGHARRLGLFSLFHKNPFKLPQHSALTLDLLTAESNNIALLVARASRLIDHPIRRYLIGDPLEPYLVYPDSVPRPSITRSKNILPGEEFGRLKDGIDLIYRMADDKEFLFRRGLKEADKNKFRGRLFDYFVNDRDDYQDLVYEIADKVDFDHFLAGAQDFADAAQRFSAAADSIVFPEERREVKTGKGLIVIGSAGDDLFEYFVPPLMIIDGSGNDTYRFSGYPDGYPLTLIIDFAGNDRYISTDSSQPGIGGAVLGMSILIDRGGDDYYEGVDVTQGAGIFGAGVLQDAGGDDVYIASGWSQAAATFGLGVLSDRSGADSLRCLTSSQGFGYTRGCGLLVDLEGDDTYLADDSNIVKPSSQTAEHNDSYAQGFGYGRRADYLDGHSWAGGVGILCDVSGDDSYSAGLFAQGCGYWHALGMLLDGGGNDRYNGVWYVQGSGAHFAVGYLDDFGGDDRYTASHNMAVGAGHDFTVGYLNERAGNDTYTVPNLSLGGGNSAGIGLFHDHSGSDTYNTSGGTTLGRANKFGWGIRTFQPCFGIFVDGGGQDIYNETWAGNGRRWIGPRSDTAHPSPYTFGVGIDRQ